MKRRASTSPNYRDDSSDGDDFLDGSGDERPVRARPRKRMRVSGSDDEDGAAAPRGGRRLPRGVLDPSTFDRRWQVPSDERIAGSIISVLMNNVRVHRNAAIDLAPRVNFITGLNGAGKSTILTAVRAALGGKVPPLSSKTLGVGAADADPFFRKPDAPGAAVQATVELVLNNSGYNALKPDVYGSAIRIVRHLHRTPRGSASSTLKLYNGDTGASIGVPGDIVMGETPEEALKEFIKHFKCFPNNPLMLMDQETSKNFLTGKSDYLYNLWMEATGLSEELAAINKAERRVEEAVKQIAALKELARASKVKKDAADAEFKRVEALQGLADAVADAQRAVRWAEALEVCAKAETAQAAVDKAKASLEKIEKFRVDALLTIKDTEDKLRMATAATEQARAARADAGPEFEALTAVIDQAKQPLLEVLSDISANKKALQEAANEQRAAEAALKRYQDEMAARDVAGARQRRQREIDAARAGVEGATKDLEAAREALPGFEASAEEAKGANEGLAMQLREAKEAEAAAKNRVAMLQSHGAEARMDAMTTIRTDNTSFSRTVVQVADWIAHAPEGFFKGPRPLGPVANFVRCDRRYATPVCAVIGPLLFNFLATPGPDASKLEAQFKAAANFRFNSIPRMARYPVGPCPIPGATRVIDVLTIEDDWVYNALLDFCSIDRFILARDEDDAERLLTGRNAKGEVCMRGNMKGAILPDGRIYTVRDSGITIRAAGGEEAKSARYLLPPVVNQADFIAEAKAELTGAANEVRRLTGEMNACAAHISSLTARLTEAKRQVTDAARRLDAAKTRLNRAEAVPLPEEPDDSEDSIAISNLQSRVDAIQQQRADIEARIAADEERREPLKARVNELNEQFKALQQRAVEAEEVIKKCEAEEANISAELGKTRQTAAKVEERRRSEIDKQDRVQADLAAAQRAAEAAKESARVDTGWDAPRDPELSLSAANRKLTAEKDNYKAETERIALTPEQVEEIRQAKAAAEREFKERQAKAKEAMGVVQALQQTYSNLVSNLGRNHAENVRKTDRAFRALLAEKGFGGKLVFEFDEGAVHKGHLRVLVVPDFSQRFKAVTEGRGAGAVGKIDESAFQDAATLSGGEKSYCGVMLVCAVARISPAPFRIIDEFDVFQDEKTRLLSVQMLLEQAEQKVDKTAHPQMMLITPLTVSRALRGASQSLDVKVVEVKKEGAAAE